MMKLLGDLEPSGVWRWFEAICAIPRPSGEEREMADFLVEFARQRSLQWKRDDADNVLITKEGRGEAADNPALLLQAHVDMVPEKRAESDHDFRTDPIVPEVQMPPTQGTCKRALKAERQGPVQEELGL